MLFPVNQVGTGRQRSQPTGFACGVVVHIKKPVVFEDPNIAGAILVATPWAMAVGQNHALILSVITQRGLRPAIGILARRTQASARGDEDYGGKKR